MDGEIKTIEYHCNCCGSVLWEEPMQFSRLWAVGDYLQNGSDHVKPGGFFVQRREVKDDVQHVYLGDKESRRR